MNKKRHKMITVSRPKDKSLEAYKAWVMDIAKKLTTAPTKIKWTEEEWSANWKAFWRERPDD